MKPVLQAAAIVLLAAIAALITWAVSGPADAPLCDPSTLRKGEICLQDIPTDRDVLWIDARSRSDWEKNGLQGSILWNYEASEDFDEMERKAVEKIFNMPYVIVYCGDKGCETSRKIAGHITDKLKLEAEVHVLHDGWKALHAAGRIPKP